MVMHGNIYVCDVIDCGIKNNIMLLSLPFIRGMQE